MIIFFDYIELRNDYSIFEISPLKEWIGHSLKDSDIGARYNISIIAVKDEKFGNECNSARGLCYKAE